MFGHTWVVVLIILVVLLILVGPRMLPKLGARLGRLARDTKEGAVEGTTNLIAEARKPDEPAAPKDSPTPDSKS